MGVDNPDLKLKPGMTANVSIITLVKKNVLKIPNAALRFVPQESGAPKTPQKGYGVWIMDTGIPKRIPVSIGISDGSFTEVVSGSFHPCRRRNPEEDRQGSGCSEMPLIRAEKITKIYHVGSADVIALDDVSLTIEKGEFVAIMGPSGSGKSTFLNIIGCLDTPTSGRYLIDGIDVRDVTLKSLRQQVGVVLQEVYLFTGTIRDNIAFGKPDADCAGPSARTLQPRTLRGVHEFRRFLARFRVAGIPLRCVRDDRGPE